MAKHTGRGYSAIEYPTGMNQNGDPSQAWIKMKPDGRVDVFSGTADIGNGSKTIQTQIVAETLGVPYDWITYDNSNTDSSPLCTGTFASRATFVAGNAVRKAALNAREKLLEIAGKELEIDPDDLEVVDGEVIAKVAAQKKTRVAGRRRSRHVDSTAELITGTGAQLKPFAAITDPATAEVDSPPLRHLVRRLRGRGGGRRRDRRGAREAALAVLRRRPSHQSDARRRTDRGRRDAGPRARGARGLLPVLPGASSTVAVSSAHICRSGHRKPARRSTRIAHREPLRGRPVRREGHLRRWRRTPSRPRSPRRSTTRSASG